MLILFCVSIILGAICFHELGLSLLTTSLISALYGAFFIFLFRKKKAVLLGVLLGLSCFLGALRFWIIEVPTVPFGNKALVGTIKKVDERLDKTIFIIREEKTGSVIQVASKEKQEFLPGDTVSFRGKVEKPQDFVTDTGKVFDYDSYLSSKGIDATMSFGQIVLLQKGALSFSRAATIFRDWIGEIFVKYIQFPIDGIVAGMLIGFQGGIPTTLSDIFRKTGTLHTLVLSGYNITVLAGFLGFLLRKLSFRFRTALTMLGIVTLVFVSGAGVAAVRAGIMGSIALFASVTLESYKALRALCVAFLFFFLTSPGTIFVDPGFHLSFLATFFIIAIVPILKDRVSWIPEFGKLNLRELLLLAFGLPLFMLPYTMYFSGFFPVITPIANIFLVPLIPILMLGGVSVLLFSFIPFLAKIFGTLTSLVGLFSIKGLALLSMLPGWQTPLLSGFLVTFIYTTLFCFLFKKEIVSFIVLFRKAFQQQSSSHF